MSPGNPREFRTNVLLARNGDIAALHKLRSLATNMNHVKRVIDILRDSEPPFILNWSILPSRSRKEIPDRNDEIFDLILVILAKANLEAAKNNVSMRDSTYSGIAMDELSTRYTALIDNLAHRFISVCSEIVEDLRQEGFIALRYQVVPKYDLGKGVPFRKYARVVIRNRMSRVCSTWTNYRTLQPVHAQTLPVDDASRLDSDGSLSNLETRQGTGASSPSSDVPLSLQRREHSSILSLDELGESHFEIEDSEADPSTRALTRTYFDVIISQLNESGGKHSDGQEGIRWIVVLVLSDFSEYTWKEVVSILKGATPIDLQVNWPLLHEEYSLPDTVPRNIERIRDLFKPGKPKLNIDNLKRWYHRRKVYLEHALNQSSLGGG